MASSGTACATGGAPAGGSTEAPICDRARVIGISSLSVSK